MKRTTLQLAREVFLVLQKEGPLSVRQIAHRVHADWRSVIGPLELYKAIGLVEEKRGRKRYKAERTFCIVQKKARTH